MKKVAVFEPWFFLFFGAFHLHRIWGLLDRKSYADFWMGLMINKGMLYYVISGVLAVLCILGIGTFLKNIRHNYWWRWIYVLGGSYLLFDLFAVAAGLGFWHKLLLKMYDVSAAYWTVLWLVFIWMGGASFALGLFLLIERKRKSWQ